MDADIAAGVFGLAGAAVGAAATALAQWQGNRSEKTRLEHERVARVNSSAIAVFRTVLAAIKKVERLAEMREAGAPPTHDEIRNATDRMWLGFQEVVVFCAPEISQSAKGFADALRHVIWHVADESVTVYLRAPRHALFESAGPILRESGLR